MNYIPKSEEELNKFTVFEEGEYDFQVLEATDEVSSNNNEQIKLKLILINEHGKPGGAYDYLLEAMLFKIKHFCEATGQPYDGYLDANMCLNKTGRCKVIKEFYKAKNRWQNKIEDYIPLAINEQDVFLKRCKDDAEIEFADDPA